MKITKRQLRKIIKEERHKLLKELLPPRAGEQWDPITQEILADIVTYAVETAGESASFDGASPADILRGAADFAEGKR